MSRDLRNLQPLDAARLEELALTYVARFATSRARLERYLRRKVRERGWHEDGEPPVAELAGRLVAAGYVDDAAFARAKASGLLRRGYGMRRVDQALAEAGVDLEPGSGLDGQGRPGEALQREAALKMARKRRFGPFGGEPPDRARREKQIAAMLRAGHPLDSARELIDAADVEAAEQWAAAGGENDRCE